MNVMEFSDLYLSDGLSQIDFVVVYSNAAVTKRRYFKRIFDNLLSQLDEFNIDYELSSSVDNENLRCLKIHISSFILEEYANFHHVEIAYKSQAPQMGKLLRWCRCSHTPLTNPDPKSEISKRQRTIKGMMESPLTQAERILLTHFALAHVRFGKGVDEVGIERILNIGVVKAIFPLHEGDMEWTTEGQSSERQMLSRYWLGVRNIFKRQPSNAIEKYFGPEMAFSYAYLELTTEMQIVASILGVLFYIIGISDESRTAKEIREYICTSEKSMCPTCNPKYCKPRHLHTYCVPVFFSNQTFDNVEMFVLGILITLWGTIFLEIWMRRQTLYRLRWNLGDLGSDLQIRTGYETRTNLSVVSPFTNELEPTMSTPDVVARVFVSAASVVLSIITVFGLEIFVIMMKMKLKILIDNNDSAHVYHRNTDTIVSVVGSAVTVIFISIIDLMYKAISKISTNWENPRTQKQYDNSFMMKCFLFAFANNYTMLSYIAFFKGKFFTNPADEEITDVRGAYVADTCQSGECNSDLAVQVMVLLGIKHLFFKCVGRYIFKMSVVLWKTFRRKKKSSFVKREQWEKDYILKSFDRYEIMKQYIEIILRHGMVSFFTSVCPLAPILTSMVNISEMKLYSYAFIKFYRRPIPRKVEGIEMFHFISQALTWFGVTVNAILAMMTKNFAKMHFYMAKDNNVTTYMEKTFSAFSMYDYKDTNVSEMIDKNNDTICYYPGNRYPPDHPRKYQVQRDQYEYNAFGWMVIVVYLHVVFLLTRIIAHFIPDSSSEVTDYLNSVHAENRKDSRIFRNQQFRSKQSIIRYLHKWPKNENDEDQDEEIDEEDEGSNEK